MTSIQLPTSMKAAVYRRPGELEVVEVPLPETGPGEVLVAVSHCGICGTDLHNVLDGWGQPDSIGGHEWSGTTVLGDPEDLYRGKDVVGGAAPGCGGCGPCRAGRPNLCRRRRSPGVDPFQGAFAEFVAVDRSALVEVPDGVDLRHAAFAEPLAIALHAVTVGGPEPGDRALVVGAGPIGAALAAALPARGVTDVTVVEPAPARRALAEALGCTTLHPDDLVVPAMPDDLVDEPWDVVFECSGARAAVESALGQVDRAGTVVLVGTGLDPPALDTNRVLLNELVVTGAFGYDPGGFDESLALIADGRVPVDHLVEPTDATLDGMLDAMAALRAGDIAGKVLVAP